MLLFGSFVTPILVPVSREIVVPFLAVLTDDENLIPFVLAPLIPILLLKKNIP